MESSGDNMEIISLAADAIDELDRVIDELGDEEVLALLRLAKRIRDGQLRYGTLNLRYDTRDWHAERQAELDDADIYTAYEDTAEELKARFKTDPAPAPVREHLRSGIWLTSGDIPDGAWYMDGARAPLTYVCPYAASKLAVELAGIHQGTTYEVRPYTEARQ
jgi:hypothetical protein